MKVFILTLIIASLCVSQVYANFGIRQPPIQLSFNPATYAVSQTVPYNDFLWITADSLSGVGASTLYLLNKGNKTQLQLIDEVKVPAVQGKYSCFTRLFVLNDSTVVVSCESQLESTRYYQFWTDGKSLKLLNQSVDNSGAANVRLVSKIFDDYTFYYIDYSYPYIVLVDLANLVFKRLSKIGDLPFIVGEGFLYVSDDRSYFVAPLAVNPGTKNVTYTFVKYSISQLKILATSSNITTYVNIIGSFSDDGYGYGMYPSNDQYRTLVLSNIDFLDMTMSQQFVFNPSVYFFPNHNFYSAIGNKYLFVGSDYSYISQMANPSNSSVTGTTANTNGILMASDANFIYINYDNNVVLGVAYS
eukprot:TRINITY_DN275_c0_g1_i1.p1 TRINITY_DN275_c0_g1~~TRINITY_DN275_c0_g1_i1.p1  ORF type:complete len:402 (+),score=55.90 TRINITY_DN275_c0_g1_i1:132-1208(+)